jgi:hypothetical protein
VSWPGFVACPRGYAKRTFLSTRQCRSVDSHIIEEMKGIAPSKFAKGECDVT